MFKTKEIRRNVIIMVISCAVCFIGFLVTKIVIRGNMSAPSGGELCVLLIPLIIYVSIKNWKVFMETCFPKDTMFDEYFDEYFTGKDMMEDKSSKVIDINEFITR